MLSKNDMARVAIQALYNSESFPGSDNINVVRKARMNKAVLKEQYDKAMVVLRERLPK